MRTATSARVDPQALILGAALRDVAVARMLSDGLDGEHFQKGINRRLHRLIVKATTQLIPGAYETLVPLVETLAREEGDPIPASTLAELYDCGEEYAGAVPLAIDLLKLRKRGKGKDAETPAPSLVEETQPWDDSVDGAELLDALKAAARRFVALPPGGADALALWVVVAHAEKAFDILPFLGLTSPVPRCGKTTTLDLLGRVVPRPLLASNISPSAVFRCIEAALPTLLVDEADTFAERSDELRGVFNSGHSRATAFVIRTEGEGAARGPVRFGTWAPRVYALIGKPPPTWEDRSILIPMRRREPRETLEKARRRTLAPLKDLGRKAARWAADNLPALTAADPEIPEGLDDRAGDNAAPLLAVADLAGGPWPACARRAILALSGGRDREEDGTGLRLLRNIKSAFDGTGEDAIPSADLVTALAGEPEWGWDALNQRSLAVLLKPFGIKPKGLRIGGRTPRGYERAQFSDAWRRYLPPDPQQPQQGNGGAEIGREGDPQQGLRVADAKPGPSVRDDSPVADVADKNPREGGQATTSPTTRIRFVDAADEVSL